MQMMILNIFNILSNIFSFASLSAKRALLVASDGGDDCSLPEQDPGGGGPRHHLQRPQGLRVVCIVLEGQLKALVKALKALATTFNTLKVFGLSAE